MKNIRPTFAAAMIASFAVMSVVPQASAATKLTKPGSVYAEKKAECTRKAEQKKWGIHRIARSNWINDCIAGKQT